MQTPIMQRLKSIVDPAISYALYLLLKPMTERYRSLTYNSAGLVITATAGKKVAKTGASITHYSAKGKHGQIAAATDMATLSGVITNGKHNVYVLTYDSAGNKYSYMGTEAATEAAVKWPTLNPEHAIIGFIKVHVTGTGTFTGGTDALDDGTIFTSAAADVLYVSCVGMSFPGARVD